MKNALVCIALAVLVGCAESNKETSVEDDATMAATDPNLVETASGPVRGETLEGVRVFRGIPYAAPPVGELRWKPPQAPASWQEARDTLAFGMPCLQPRFEGFYDRGPIETAEDCLYLNVWTRAEAGASLPVMVWIHGGALQIGHGHLPMYDGGTLTSKGVVVVSINYRLGVLGFLAHEALSAESPSGVSGNYGILDQIAALEWGARQHRGIRRRSEQCHDLRRIRRLMERVLSLRIAAGPRAVPPRHRPIRRLFFAASAIGGR